MGIEAAYIMPHPPLAVEGVGDPAQKEAIPGTMDSYEKIAREIAQLAPDTIILTSPHAPMYADYFHVSAGKGAKGDFSIFGSNVSLSVDYDEDFVANLSMFCQDAYFPAGEDNNSEKLDHGTMVPLYFVNKYYRDYRLVRIGLSGMPLEQHYLFGKFIKKVVDAASKKIVFIASGDLSHYQKNEGPYGYRPEGPLYDETLMTTLKEGRLKELPSFNRHLLESAGECGHRSFCIMAGCLDDEETFTRVLSHENTFGVGYGFAAIEVLANRDSKSWETWEEAMMYEMKRYHEIRVDKFTNKMEAAIMENQDMDSYVSLARRTINAHVLGETLPDIEEGLPEEMTKNRAGTFVSIHKNGHLRGCIGTILATKKSIAEEIRANAISAATNDPRFPMITADELSELEINVDVLTEPEMVASQDELDAKKYGVIVQNGNRLGLLLPDLEGVDTVSRQIEISKAKAGIGPTEPVELMRFSVIRHK